jgi:hypothetical protein
MKTARAQSKPAPSDWTQKEASTQYTAPLSQTTQPSYVPQSVALSGPREIRDYNEGDPVPPGYRPVQRIRKGLVIGGSVLFGTLYLFSAFAAAVDSDAGDGELSELWIPAVGPFIQLAQTESATGKFFLALDGLGQSAGLFMLVYGLASPKTVLVRNDLANMEVRVAPMAGRGTSGIALTGTF